VCSAKRSADHDGQDAETLSRRIAGLATQVASIPAFQAHARQVEVERNLLVGKFASEAHAADAQLN
jgi:hypothetical protein